MDPANPPLPSPRYLPFHPVSGSHTSILISESLAGLIVAATRQNAGRFFTEAGGTLSPGGINAPAATACANVMVVSGRFSAARLSQVAATAKPGVARRISTKASKQVCTRRTSFTNIPPDRKLKEAKSYQNRYRLKMNSAKLTFAWGGSGRIPDFTSRRSHADFRSPFSGSLADYDFYIPAKRVEKIHEAFHGKSIQTIIRQSGYFRLIYFQYF